MLGKEFVPPVITKLDLNVGYSAQTFEEVAHIFPSLNSVKGERILDVGASQSNTAARLRKKGAFVVAIDKAYVDMIELDQVVNFAYDLTGNSPSRQMEIEVGRDEFRSDLAINQGYYIAADARALPFRDRTFTIVFSNVCVTSYLAHDWESLRTAFDEMLRVVTDNGKVMVAPSNGWEYWKERKLPKIVRKSEQNMKRLYNLLDSQGYKIQMANFDLFDVDDSKITEQTMTIYKRRAIPVTHLITANS